MIFRCFFVKKRRFLRKEFTRATISITMETGVESEALRMIHGIIDIGSNTIRMAVYRIEYGKIELLLKKKHAVGLASYVEENRMKQEGIDKACEVLEEFRVFLTTFQIKHVTAFTTAALRNVENSRQAVAEIHARTGIDVQVISGEEEATFDFIGATYSMVNAEGILVDIGGASTEIVHYRERKILHAASLPLGSLAMYAKYVEGLLPSRAEIVDIAAETKRVIEAEASLVGVQYAEFCGIGGTFKGTKQLNNALFHLPKQNERIALQHVDSMIAQFSCEANTVSNDILDVLVNVVPERIKTILPGMVIVREIAVHFGSEAIVYSDSGVREGYLYDKVLPRLGKA